jgi:GMP synthase (glutamine-hydrolysing)
MADPLPGRIHVTERLRTDLRVQVWLRRCAAAGLMATVARKGDPSAGALFLKVNRFAGGCEVFSGVSRPDGQPAWLKSAGPLPERDADAYLERQGRYDPDLWVLEIEDPRGQFSLDEPVVEA